MILDLTETPILAMLQVNGRLTFIDEEVAINQEGRTTSDITDITLHAYHVFVRAGELNIGTEEKPF